MCIRDSPDPVLHRAAPDVQKPDSGTAVSDDYGHQGYFLPSGGRYRGIYAKQQRGNGKPPDGSADYYPLRLYCPLLFYHLLLFILRRQVLSKESNSQDLTKGLAVVTST